MGSLLCDLDLEDSKQVFSLRLMIMHHYTKAGNKMFSSSEDISRQTFISILKLNNFFFHTTLWHTRIYHQTKFDCKRVSSSDDVEQSFSDYINPYCDLDLQDSKPIFLHVTPTHDDTPPYQVWLQKAEWFRIYLRDKHLLTFKTLTRPWTQQSSFSHGIPTYNNVP